MYDISDVEDNRESVATSDIEVNRASIAATDTEDEPTGFGDRSAEDEEESEKEPEEEPEADMGDELVESEYDQEAEDMASETCVDPTKDWDSLEVSDLPRGSGSDNDDGSEDLESLDGSNGDEDDARPVRKFIRRRYHEFNPTHDIHDLVFRLGMEFSGAAVFRKAIGAYSVKHRRIIKFKNNDPNSISVVCRDDGCKWFVFASWLSDHKIFKIKSLLDDHTCVMSFKNKFVSSKFIDEKYVGQWRVNPDWNYTGMAKQLWNDTNVDASKW
ncbi:hypothetical protein Ddye_025860 [Dipteronia dyeriana]|uniref:Transposase MuDR plant domain-containing protein n=1 Tax=Dipteronia dyeriana TaxID=168575 RepID=A0AAD9TM52_9ROSI|nr:hypothetical protein Ddye_025860 [Dipteronia dyeriana]